MTYPGVTNPTVRAALAHAMKWQHRHVRLYRQAERERRPESPSRAEEQHAWTVAQSQRLQQIRRDLRQLYGKKIPSEG